MGEDVCKPERPCSKVCDINLINTMVEAKTDVESGGMAEVPEEELAKMIAMLSKLSRFQGMKIPGAGSYSRDELIRMLKARDPDVLTLIVMYRERKAEVLKNAKRDLLDVVKHAPIQDKPVAENMFIVSNPKGYNAREISQHIEGDTPEGMAFVQQFYEESRGGKMRAVKRYINAQPSAVKTEIAIRSLVEWGRSMIEGVLRLGKTEQKKLEK